MLQFLKEKQGTAIKPLTAEERVELEQLRKMYSTLKSKLSAAGDTKDNKTAAAVGKGKAMKAKHSSSDSEVSSTCIKLILA